MKPLLAPALLAVLSTSACRPADAQGSVASDDATTGKLNLYVFCVNQLSRQVLEDPKPLEVTPVVAERCRANLHRAGELRPRLPALEEAAIAYERALEGVRASDGPRDALATFESADAALRRAIDDVQHQLDERELARLEKSGGLRFHARLVVARGERMVKAVATSEAAMKTATEEYLAAQRALAQALAARQEKGISPSADVSGPLSAFVSSAEDLASGATGGSAADLVDEYNRMVGYWNMLTWRR